MAKFFGYPINVEEGGNGGVSSISGEASRSATQSHGEATQSHGEATSSSSGLPLSEINHPYTRFFESGSFPMDTESDLDNCFIDFFGRESYEIETVCDGGFGEMEEDESVELGLGIGAGSGSGDKESGSGRVEVGADLAPFADDLFCEEEAMLMADEVLEWENLQNGINWELDPVEEEEEEEEEDEEEDIGEEEELDLQSNANLFLENLESQVFSPVEDFYEESVDAAEDILMEAMEVTSFMDFDYGDLLHELNADFVDAFFHPHPFNQGNQPPPPIMPTRPASKRFVADLPLVEITSEELSNGNVVCAICIGDLVVEEKVRRLPCRHYYHGECIVPWLGMKNTCPVCRYELPTDDDIVCVMNRSRM